MRSAAKPALLQLGDLVFHQGDQRADHQRGAAARDARQLVAERLAGAGGHDQQHVLRRSWPRGRPLPGWAGRRETEGASAARSPASSGAGGRTRRMGRRQASDAQLGGGPARGNSPAAAWARSRGCALRPHLADHFAHVILDAFEEGLQLRAAALDALEVALPTGRSSPGSSLPDEPPRSVECPCPVASRVLPVAHDVARASAAPR